MSHLQNQRMVFPGFGPDDEAAKMMARQRHPFFAADIFDGGPASKIKWTNIL
jgi:hypothetical protein